MPHFVARPYDESNDAWDEYVRQHPEGRFCHLTAYQSTLRKSFSFHSHRFALWRDGRLCAVIPLCEGRSLLFSNKWVSMPYTEYGGFLADHDVPAQELAGLVAAVSRAASRASVRGLELNGLLGLQQNETFVPAVSYDAAVLDLGPGPDDLFKKVFAHEVRKAIRKAESRGLKTHEASDQDIIADLFYPMYLENMHRLGVPPLGLSYFTALRAGFGDDLRIFWAERDGQPVAGLLGIRSGSRVQITVTVSTPVSWEDRPNDLTHWAFVRWACEVGARWFDFGSVRYEGQRHYKKKWGAEFRPAAHWVANLGSRHLPVVFDSSSPTMSRASRLWKAGVPLRATPWLGPMIRRQLLR